MQVYIVIGYYEDPDDDYYDYNPVKAFIDRTKAEAFALECDEWIADNWDEDAWEYSAEPPFLSQAEHGGNVYPIRHVIWECEMDGERRTFEF